MFCTMHFAQLREHTTLGCIYWIPLYIFFFLKYFDLNKKVYGIITALVFAFTFQESQYYAWCQFVFSFTYFLYILYPHFKEHREIFIPNDIVKKIVFLTSFVVLFNLNFIIPQAIAIFKKAAITAYRKPHPASAMGFAPHIWEYFTPNPFHPLWGDFFKKFLQNNRPGNVLVEFPIFTGYTAMLTGAYSIYRFLKKDRFFFAKEMWVFLWLIPLAVIFALPVYLNIGSFRIFTPSGVVASLIPFRALSRYSILIVLSLAIFSAAGVSYFCFRHAKYKIFILLVFSLAVMFEFVSDYKDIFTKLKFPEYTEFIKNRKEEVIVEVPVSPFSGENFAVYKFNQINHKKKMFNGVRNDRYGLYKKLDDEKEKVSMGDLGDLGIGLAVYHDCVPSQKNRKYLSLLKSFQGVSVFKVKKKRKLKLTLEERKNKFESLFKGSEDAK